MARARSPDRDKAFELWRNSKGTLKLKEIAEQLGVADSQVRKWKSQDKWDGQLKGNVTKRKSNVTNKSGAPKGNKNAVGNKGGSPPIGNQNAATHGFYSNFIPVEDIPIIETVPGCGNIERELALARYKLAKLLREQQNREMLGVMGGPDGPANYRLKDDFYEDMIRKQTKLVADLEGRIYKAKIEWERLELERQRVELAKKKIGNEGGNNKPIEILIKRKEKSND